MRRRDLLHYTKINEFVDFAESNGYISESTKGEYEVLRLRKKSVSTQTVIIGHKKLTCDHVTLTGEGVKLFTLMKKGSK